MEEEIRAQLLANQAALQESATSWEERVKEAKEDVVAPSGVSEKERKVTNQSINQSINEKEINHPYSHPHQRVCLEDKTVVLFFCHCTYCMSIILVLWSGDLLTSPPVQGS